MKLEKGDAVLLCVYSFFQRDDGMGPDICQKQTFGEWDGEKVVSKVWSGAEVRLDDPYWWSFDIDDGNPRGDRCVDIYCLTTDPDFMEGFLHGCLCKMADRLMAMKEEGK